MRLTRTKNGGKDDDDHDDHDDHDDGDESRREEYTDGREKRVKLAVLEATRTGRTTAGASETAAGFGTSANFTAHGHHDTITITITVTTHDTRQATRRLPREASATSRSHPDIILGRAALLFRSSPAPLLARALSLSLFLSDPPVPPHTTSSSAASASPRPPPPPPRPAPVFASLARTITRRDFSAFHQQRSQAARAQLATAQLDGVYVGG